MIFGSKNTELEERIKELEAQVKRMQDALEFYAKKETWEGGHKYRDPDNATIFADEGDSAASVDNGAQARRALGR